MKDPRSERRKFNRKYLAFFTRVFDRSTGELIGHLANVTSEGAMLITERPIEVDKTFRMFMDLSEAFFEKSHLDFEAQCIWCQPDIAPQFYNAGFRFTQIAADDIGIIEGIIAAYGIRD